MIKFNEVTWYSKLGAIVLFILVIPVLTFYIGTQYQAVKDITEQIPVITPIDTSKAISKKLLPDSFFTDEIKQKNPDAEQVSIVGRGDINKDGFEDAIIMSDYCGAGCVYHLSLALNNNNQSVKEINVDFDGINGSPSAFKSLIATTTIRDAVISVTGSGFDCQKVPEKLIDEQCRVSKDNQWLDSKTIQYRFNGAKIIRLN